MRSPSSLSTHSQTTGKASGESTSGWQIKLQDFEQFVVDKFAVFRVHFAVLVQVQKILHILLYLPVIHLDVSIVIERLQTDKAETCNYYKQHKDHERGQKYRNTATAAAM